MRNSAGASIGARGAALDRRRTRRAGARAAASEPSTGGARPAVLVAADQPVACRGSSRAPKRHQTRQVEAARRRVARLRQRAQRQPRSGATPIGRLTRNTQRQPGPSTSSPPTSGPIASAAPVIAPQTPSANAALRALELVREQRQRGGEHRRGPDRPAPRGRRRARRPLPAAAHSAEHAVNSDQAGGEHRAAAVAVGERARRSAASRRASARTRRRPTAARRSSRPGPPGSPAARR